MSRDAGEPRRAARKAVGWLRCDFGSGGCTGARVEPYRQCWSHLGPADLDEALQQLAPGTKLDVRGTTLDGRLLAQILRGFCPTGSSKALIGTASFEGVKVDGEAPFGGAVFTEDARFFDARFSQKTDFYGAEFRGYAGFNNAEFGYADFEKARFLGNVTSFKYVKFRGAAEFQHSVFEGTTEFVGAEFLDSAYFQHLEVMGDAHFERVKFGGVASFQHGVFRDRAAFSGAKFRYWADFIDVQFGGDSSFGHAKIDDNAWFSTCKFTGKSDFSETRFKKGAWFDGSHFEADASFAAAKVGADALFNEVDFASSVTLDDVRITGATILRSVKVGGQLRMSDFTADGTVEIIAAANEVRCTRAKFNERTRFSLVGGEIWLTDCVFASPTTIESSGHTATKGGLTATSLSRVRIKSLRGTDAEHLTLTDADLSRCVLSGIRRPEQIRLGGRCVFAETPRGLYWRWAIVPWRWARREALFEEHLWRSRVSPGPRRGWAYGGIDAAADGHDATPERLEVLYRQLRASLETARNEPGAADFYYGEMEMRRRAAGSRAERWLLDAYWLVSGYGLRATRALAALAVLVLLAALLLQHLGFNGHEPSYLYTSLYALGSVVSLSLASGHLPSVITAWGDSIHVVLRVGGPVLLGLAALAVRARVKR